MNPLLILAGKPLAGFLAGATLFYITPRKEVMQVELEEARLRAEVEALEAEAEARERFLVPEGIEEAKRKLAVPEELKDARKGPREGEDKPDR